MANIGKILGQLAPAATTDTDLYTVPDVTQTVVSSLIACNRSGGGLTYQVSVRPLGAAIENKHRIFQDFAIAANITDKHVIGMTLSQDDVVTVQASSGDMSFSLFGVETTD